MHFKRAIGVRVIEILLYNIKKTRHDRKRITKIRLFKYIENFTTKNKGKLSDHWAANSVDRDQSPCPVYTIQLYRVFFAIL